MKMNEYSVLMPLYKKDNPEWFQYALDSILNQTKVPNEIVITCDGPLSEELENTLQKNVKKIRTFTTFIDLRKMSVLELHWQKE